MGATLLMANEMQGYCLSDRGTWLSTKKNADNDLELEVICEGDTKLFNQYSVIAVSTDKYPDVKIDAANAFIEWICSAEVQELIRQFGVEEFGEPLFVPNAK
jgi:tungstate transport system substrate-binding protein